MNYEELKEFVYSAPFDVMTEVYRNGDDVLSVYRPTKLSKRFKDYDVKKNFQIFMKEGKNKEFRPNHLRMFIDLKLRVMEHPELKIMLLESFDKIFYGSDPYKAVKVMKNHKFTLCLNSIETIACLAQLFLLEQNEGFGQKSKYNPPSLYLQGWIRTFLYESTVDDLLKSLTRNNPPKVKYTKRDDRNHKDYVNHEKSLWYL